MFKSVQGHQYLCDILRKSLLHRNPRNEGVGFERKLNSDGSYWEPEQYPKTVWVLAKEKPIDIANLSGFHCKMDKSIVDESLDSDYKLIKDEYILFKATPSKCIRSANIEAMLPTEVIPNEAFTSIIQIFDAYIQGESKASHLIFCSKLNSKFHILYRCLFCQQ